MAMPEVVLYEGGMAEMRLPIDQVQIPDLAAIVGEMSRRAEQIKGEYPQLAAKLKADASLIESTWQIALSLHRHIAGRSSSEACPESK